MKLSDPLFHSLENYPNGLALQHRTMQMSYRRLHDDVEAIAVKLNDLGVRRGRVVGVYITQAAAHWVVLLALMRLGATSVSLTAKHQEEIATLPSITFLIQARESVIACPAHLRSIEIGPEWLTTERPQTITLPALDEVEEHVERICFTSGTSGKPKPVHLDAALLRRRLSGTAQKSMINTRSVLWCGLGPDTAYGFTATLSAWLVGAQIVFAAKREELYSDIINGKVNLILSSPAAIQAVLQSSGGNFHTRFDGEIIIAGGVMSKKLRDLLWTHLCQNVFIAYGSSETGGITLGHSQLLDKHIGLVGTAYADAAVEIVNEVGELIPVGASGRVRMKSASSIAGYLGAPPEDAEYFEGGWFYPGDLGSLSKDGHLMLLGRAAETLNIGGMKFSAAEIDAAVLGKVGIRDACAVVIEGDFGAPRLAIAAAGEIDAISELAIAVRAALPTLPPFSVVAVSAIPRSSMGKVNRAEFGRLIARRLDDFTSTAESDGFALLRSAEDGIAGKKVH